MPADDVNRTDPVRWDRCLDDFVDHADEAKRALLAQFLEALGAMIDDVVSAVRAAQDRGETVTVVLVSRRMSCLYEMFRTCGFDDLAGVTVVSDRGLDGGVRLTPGQRVVVVDDVVNLGSTLVDLYDRVVDLTGDTELVDVFVACVDRDRSSPAFREHLGLPPVGEGPLIWCDQRQIEVIATSIAATLYRNGRPYFTDFPLLVELPLDDVQIDALTKSERWYVADVTPPRDFAGPNRSGYSFVPRPDTERAIRARTIPEASRLIDGMKVRVYVGPNVDGELAVRVVPMGLPGAMTVKELQAAVRAVSDDLEGTRDLAFDQWEKPAWHRLLQMYASACVLAEFWDDMASVGLDRALGRDVLEPVHVLTYFGEADAARVLDAFEETVSRYSAAEESREAPDKAAPLVPGDGMVPSQRRAVNDIALQSKLLTDSSASMGDVLVVSSSAVPPAEPDPSTVARVNHLWVYRVLNVFGRIDRALERPQEEQIQRLTYEQYEWYRKADGTFGDSPREPSLPVPGTNIVIGPRVIRRGLSLGELTRIVLPYSTPGDPWARALASFAVDIGNDMGIIVPSTVERDDVVWRMYRSGETAFVAGRPHQAMRSEQDWANLDEFTQYLASSGEIGTVADLAEDTARQNDATHVDQAVRTAMIGEVTEIDEEGLTFEAVVTDMFDTTGLDTKTFVVGELPVKDRSALRPGVGIIYRRFDEAEQAEDVRLEPVIDA